MLMRLVAWWQVEAKVKELREVSAGDDTAAIKAKIEELQKEVMAIGQVRCCAPADACGQASVWLAAIVERQGEPLWLSSTHTGCRAENT